jgi:hypothetical protein
MSYPVIKQVATSNSAGVAVTSHPVRLGQTPTVNDLLIVAFTSIDDNGVTWPSGWTQLSTTVTGAGTRLSIRYKVNATETGSITLTTAASSVSASLAIVISAGTYIQVPEVGTAATGTTAPNPPSLTASWGVADNLWIVFGGSDGAGTLTYPAGFVRNRTTVASTTVANCAMAARLEQTATEDPPAWAGFGAAVESVAQTLVVSGLTNTRIISPKWQSDVIFTQNGKQATIDQIGATNYWSDMQVMMQKSITAGAVFSNPITLTYSGAVSGYNGGVLGSDGKVYYIPRDASRGMIVDPITNSVSTYSLIYTVSTAYAGGVLAPNGDIHFVPLSANVGQKVSSSGIVSTYSLVYTAASAYFGGVLSTSGETHFVPRNAAVGQKVSSTGTVSTYSLLSKGTDYYIGAVLSKDGEIHFIPWSAPRGQKISTSGVVSTYSLIYTGLSAYCGGVLDLNGDIHFVPFSATVGQKVSAAGVVSTYSLVYTTGSAYLGGVLAPNGDIHFIQSDADRGQKISKDGVVSTYSLAFTGATSFRGGVLTPSGDVYMVPWGSPTSQVLNTGSAIPFGKGICLSPHYNKL